MATDVVRSSRSLPVLSIPRTVTALVLLVDVTALSWSASELAHVTARPRPWAVLAVLVVLALLFEEGSTRTSRLHLRLSSDLKRDMTSVWAVTGAVALPPAQAVLLVGADFAFAWWRHHRPAGQPAYRGWYAASTQVLGCLVAGTVIRTCAPLWQHWPWTLGGAMSVIVAIVMQTAVNRLLITVALLGIGVRREQVLGSRDDNLVEFATLCLGGLVALAAADRPWLAVLVLPPMIGLHRGAWFRELEAAATVDAKTGLLNAMSWDYVADRELARARRLGTPVAVLIADVDRFKRVNDRYGHLVGDAVLRAIGSSLADSVRQYDTVGRFGGEEFVAVLPLADEVDALVVAERLRSSVNRLPMARFVDEPVRESVNPQETLAVSIGVACFPADGAELPELLYAADAALYRAKDAGRNRVLLAERTPPGTSARTA